MHGRDEPKNVHVHAYVQKMLTNHSKFDLWDEKDQAFKNAQIFSIDLIKLVAISLLPSLLNSWSIFLCGDSAAVSLVCLVKMWVLPLSLLNDGWRQFIT